MTNYFIFNGHKSTEFGMKISGGSTFNAPQRRVETYVIPGRNGTLTIDNGSFENISVQYNASIVKDFAKNLQAVRQFFLSSLGYFRLEDSYHPTTFRMARFSGGITLDSLTQLNKAGTFKLVFDCKPQRFLKSGEIALPEITSSAPNRSVYNPTRFDASPIISINCTDENGCEVQIGNGYITMYSAGNVTIDTETMIAVDESGALFSDIEYTIPNNEDFLLCGGGITAVSLNSGTATVSIIPRWWEL